MSEAAAPASQSSPLESRILEASSGVRGLGKTAATPQNVIDAIRAAAKAHGRAPSRSEFLSHSGMSSYAIDKHYASWNDAVAAAGFAPNSKFSRLDEESLLKDWGEVVRRLRVIPTLVRYRHEGGFSPEVFQNRFGAWSKLPDVFRGFADGKPEWADVVALLPVAPPPRLSPASMSPGLTKSALGTLTSSTARHSKLGDRPTYGNPIDFRGLRHEPVNEQGVVFLFGMVAKELGYMVEAVQTGYPDCEAKRQVGPSNWQRVRIEFEFESRNFCDHGHPPDGCDVIVCWRHNWAECPEHLEVVELSSVIQTLSKSED